MHVVIIGAGPAGSSAAAFLSRAGARVTLLEKGRFPRDKVCGDGLTPRALWMLERMGLRDLAVAKGSSITQVLFGAPGGFLVEKSLPARIFGGRAAVVPREQLDHLLVDHAVRAGASLVEGALVQRVAIDAGGAHVALADGRTIDGDVVLGCDGAPSVVRKALGAADFPDHHSAFAVRVYYQGLKLSRPEAYALYWEKDLLPAYGWIFPLPDGRANVGLGLRTDQMRARGEKLPQLFERFCQMPRIAPELAGATRVGKVKGHPLPFGSHSFSTGQRVAYDRALLLGDAAGFINPLTGEGIEFALESGELAAHALVDADRRGDLSRTSLSTYERACRDRFADTFRWNFHMQKFFTAPKRVDRVLKAAHKSDAVTDALADILLGEKPRITPRLAVALALGI